MQMFGDWFTVERIKTLLVTPAIIHLRINANKSEMVSLIVRKIFVLNLFCIDLRQTGRNTVWILGPDVLES